MDRELILQLGDDIRDYVCTVIDRSQIVKKNQANLLARDVRAMVIEELKDYVKLNTPLA
jgi:hypothetical protein